MSELGISIKRRKYQNIPAMTLPGAQHRRGVYDIWWGLWWLWRGYGEMGGG